MFEAFPFPHRLGLEFRLSERGVTVTYTIHNQGEAELPFGFGLHPYFQKLAGEEGTFVCLPADSVMEATSDLLPTGRLRGGGRHAPATCAGPRPSGRWTWTTCSPACPPEGTPASSTADWA